MVANAFVWYLSGFGYLQDVAASRLGGNSLLIIAAANFASLVLSAFAVSSITSKIKSRPLFLKYWFIAGALLSVFFAFLNLADFASLLFLASIVGVYFGVGMPICMGYYSKSTAPQNRAKLSGIIILLIGLGYPLISIIGSRETVFLAAALGSWQILGLISLLSTKPLGLNLEQKEHVTYRSIISNKTFLLYAAPWLMFSLINELTMQ